MVACVAGAKDVPFHVAPPGSTLTDLVKKPGGLGALPVRPPTESLVEAGDFYTLPNGAKSAITDRDFTIATVVAPSGLKSSEGDTTKTEGEAEGE